MREIEWAAFHFIEDENADHKYLKTHLDMLLAFVNPQAFKVYNKQSDPGQTIENEAFEEELKSRGITMDRFDKMGTSETDEGYRVEEVESGLDIIG